MESAQNNKNHVLITDVGSYLGSELAKSLLAEGYVVYGQGASHLSQKLLSEKNFTLLEIDLAQPLPAYLPNFDIIFDLTPLRNNQSSFGQLQHTSPQLSNIISLVKAQNSQVFIFANISAGEDFYDQLTGADEHLRERISLFLTGDVYGPGMPLNQSEKLTSLISQAIKSDKVILENEGLDHVYPAYITDVVFLVNKIAFSKSPKKVHYLTSAGAVTTLSLAYELQSAARFCANKEIGLFFSGPQDHIYPDSQIVIRHHDETIKTDIKDGLKMTFDYFFENGHVEKQHHVDNPGSPQAQSSHLPAAFINTPEKKSKIPSLPGLPIIALDFKFKKVVLVVLVVLLLTVVKTGVDLYLGQKDIKAAQKSMLSGDFKNGHSQAQSSEKSFKAAANKVKILTSPATLIAPKSTSDVNTLLQSAQLTAKSAAYFIEGAETLAMDFSQITNPDAKKEDFNLETPSANFNRAYINSSQAQYLLENNKLAQSRFKSAADQVRTLKSLSQRAYEVTNMTTSLVGTGEKRTYLVLFVNNTELRPGGGFIGNFAIVEFDQGKLQNIQVEDVYTIDGQLKEKIDPPAPLKEKLGVENFYLRDSNWSGDFQLNSKTVRDFFKKETGRDVDGVISVDLTLVQEILSKMGPITLSDYGNEQITAENLFERGEYYSEVGFFPGSTQKRDFFGALTRAMITKIVTSIQKPEIQKAQSGTQTTTLPWLALIEGASDGLPQKHLMLTFDDPILSSFVKTKGWDQPLPPVSYNPADDANQTRDYLALVEANVGANKVNRLIDRKVAYEMTVGKDADLVAKLTITYTNNSQAETWPAGKYVNFLRVYTPFASSLFEYKNGDSTDLAQVETTIQGPLTVLSTYVEVPIKSSKSVSFTYRIPKNIKLEAAPTYSIYFQKQAGTEKDPLEFKFNLPAYLQTSSVNGDKSFENQQNLTIGTDLATDRQFTIDLEKK